ncbi:hypothetical protein CWS19_23860 [Escherichia coli]|nr:hypothetical protein [Escherichia coli]MDN1346690.1 hypothetical protein [Escherichia coli]PKD48862.1 hypothetical protein CWS19_23860 [Escherichia coli]QDM86820.1 hypothetical protein FNJ79_19140 [Escherichia coli]RRO41953.1 hypothetical protein AWG39_019210 [Escherichia coli]
MALLLLRNITPSGLPRVSSAIFSAFIVSLLSGENDIAHPRALLRTEQVLLRGIPIVYLSRYTSRHHT